MPCGIAAEAYTTHADVYRPSIYSPPATNLQLDLYTYPHCYRSSRSLYIYSSLPPFFTVRVASCCAVAERRSDTILRRAVVVSPTALSVHIPTYMFGL